MSVEVGLLYSRIRRDEKLLLSELRDRGHEVHKTDVRDTTFAVGDAAGATATGVAGGAGGNDEDDAATVAAGDTGGGDAADDGTSGDDADTTTAATDAAAALTDCDVVLDRCLATSRSLYTTRFADAYGVPVVNDPETARLCADKVETSLTLAAAGLPTPATTVAFDTESALAAVESFGYPCVLKPVVGSWGRLMAKLEGRAAAEAVLEHKATLGHYEHKVFYVQDFVAKPGRDVRVLVCGTEPVAAMTRAGDHWLTNAKRGAETAAFELDETAAGLATAAAEAVGGGLLGVDLMETGDGGYTVHEVNHTVEFQALNDAVDADVPAAVVDWLEATTDTTHQATV